MTSPLYPPSDLKNAFAALRQDLIQENGPSISTMRNYRFAIVQYDPEKEFDLRRETRQLRLNLVANGWNVLLLDLQKLFLNRVRTQENNWAERVVQMEERMNALEPQRGLNYLKDKLTPLIEGPDGIAADCSREIRKYIEQHSDKADRTLVMIGRAGALYPFFRSSALLRHLDGNTQNTPVVLLYPGTRRGSTGLSFMGILEPDNDYRPRIYP